MKVYRHETDVFELVRTHPWNHAAIDPSQRYIDFKLHPELIRGSLEDFSPFDAFPAINHFYDLLEWINGGDSVFESNDCGAGSFKENQNQSLHKRLELNSRLMILYRNLPWNLSREHVDWLDSALLHYLNAIDPGLDFAVIGTTVVKAKYVSLPVAEEQQFGYQLVLSYWAWGDSETEVMGNLGRAFENTRHALTGISREILENSN